MDYWEYLAHGQKGTERDNHRYYARELVGNRGGKNVYRYFYSAEEYALSLIHISEPTRRS